MKKTTIALAVAVALPCWAAASPPDPPGTAPSPAPEVTDAAEAPWPALPADELVRTLEPPALRRLAEEVLARHPEIARARHRAAAAAFRTDQQRALPDPVAALTLFVLPPETRVGPQELSLSVSQWFPWFGKLALREKAAFYAAAAAEAAVETVRLDLLTETRRLYYELAFLDEHARIARDERRTLDRYEAASQARYASGSGLQQESLRIQAQITRTDGLLLEIAERRATLVAAVNALRDRPAGTAVEVAPPAALEPETEPAWILPTASYALDELRRRARRARPDLVAADAEIARHRTMTELAEKDYRPDVALGLGWTRVGDREDAPGRLAPPPGNGDDILALTGSVRLPVWRKKLAAGVEEAAAARSAAEEAKRRLLTDVERSIGDLAARLPLLVEHWRLLDGPLHIQAREALRSAEIAYRTGRLGAVDLLDAEVVLFDVRKAEARIATDHAVAVAELERAIAGPLGPAGPAEAPQGPAGVSSLAHPAHLEPAFTTHQEEPSDDR